MADVKKITVKIGADTRELEKGVKKAEKSVSSFGKQLKSMAGLVGAAFSVRAVFQFGKAVLQLADTQQKAERSLLVALDGRKAAQQDLIAQAAELQKTTLFGDEETIRAQSLIAAFVGEADAIKKVIPLVQDMAAAKGMDLAGAADLVAKTLGSSTNALSRYGIEVTGAVGSTQRLTSLVDGLSAAFLGQAEAAAAADLVMTQLKNRIGDIGESIGLGLSKALVFAADAYNAKFNPEMWAANAAAKAYAETMDEVNTALSNVAAVEERLGKLSKQKRQWEEEEIERRKRYNTELAETLRLQREQIDITEGIGIDAALMAGEFEGSKPGATPRMPWNYLYNNGESTEGMDAGFEAVAEDADDANNAVKELSQTAQMAISSIVNLGSSIGAALSGAEDAVRNLGMAIIDNIGALMMSMGMMTANPALFLAGAAIQLGSGIFGGMDGKSTTQNSRSTINMKIRGDEVVGVVDRVNYSNNINT